MNLMTEAELSKHNKLKTMIKASILENEQVPMVSCNPTNTMRSISVFLGKHQEAG